MKQRTTGWIFDAYAEGDAVRLWLITPEGRHFSFIDRWRPGFCVDENYAGQALAAAGPLAQSIRLEKADLYTGARRAVREIRLPFDRHGPVVKRLRRERAPIFNADIHPIQQYHYERGHFPLAFGEWETEEDRLLGFALQDDPWAVDYELPPLTTLHLSLAGGALAGKLDPNHRAMGNLLLRFDGKEHELEPEDCLETLARRLAQWDPDIITTDWGDSYLLPRLLEQYRRAGRPAPFSRDPGRSHAGRGERSFYTYGRTVYQTGSIYLFGRWHFDLQNSFYFRECGADGLYEIARIAKIPVQRAARTTIGTALSSMQLDHAHRRGLLVPMDKQQAEDFRPATDLVLADKGGLVYEAPVGWYDHVVEYDFVSMYPTIMVKNNISPETVNCACCKDNVVPEIGHNLCQKRLGLVPQVLAPILKKRAEYKKRARTDSPRRLQYKNRASAHKWILVCCLDGKTQVLYRENGIVKTGPIQKLIDRHADGAVGILPPKTTLEAIGLRHNKTQFVPVRNLIRKPAPASLLRLRIGGGRLLDVTPDHDCYVLENGALVKRKAADLKPGEWIPVMRQIPEPASFPDDQKNSG